MDWCECGWTLSLLLLILLLLQHLLLCRFVPVAAVKWARQWHNKPSTSTSESSEPSLLAPTCPPLRVLTACSRCPVIGYAHRCAAPPACWRDQRPRGWQPQRQCSRWRPLWGLPAAASASPHQWSYFWIYASYCAHPGPWRAHCSWWGCLQGWHTQRANGRERWENEMKLNVNKHSRKMQ